MTTSSPLDDDEKGVRLMDTPLDTFEGRIVRLTAVPTRTEDYTASALPPVIEDGEDG